ncbi:ammonium transporter Rh type B-like [Amphiura filiformis]|uniref:ammonium transporter Rh type B-like n=1 Tax=Amphiura filiformis TaxID=82378 RepID=UPI003B21CBA7
MAWYRGKLAMFLLIFQAIFLVLFGVLVEYDPAADARTEHIEEEHGYQNPVDFYYAMFQDVHVMVFVGFGFLMTFLRKYSFSSVGFNFLAAFMIEWATLMRGFMELGHHHGKITVNIESMILADFTAATVLISFGALLGKISPLQLIIMAFIEVILAVVNEYIALEIFGAVDVGGSMVIHAFGAYFGLTVARVLATEKSRISSKEGSNYTSDLFSMIGTIFLWLFWPSFNSALAAEDARHRAVLNTYYSLAACCIVTFAFSSLFNKEGKMQMEHIQNATLAGGVAVGTTADLMIFPWGAVLLGSLAGFITTFGFHYVTPWMSKKLKIHDTCGVNNLHGMPGIVAALGGAVVASLADKDLYGRNLYVMFPALKPGGEGEMEDMVTGSPEKMMSGRSASGQAGYQLAALAVTLVIAIVGGLVTGFVLKLPFWNEPKEDDELFDDHQNWELPEEEERMINGNSPSKKPLTKHGEAEDKV